MMAYSAKFYEHMNPLTVEGSLETSLVGGVVVKLFKSIQRNDPLTPGLGV